VERGLQGLVPTQGGHKCYPLTITDGYSRYLLRCTALEHPDMLASREVFDAAFVEFGLPTTLRTDNGTPFSGVYGVSALSVWWVKLGIQPERIERGKPTQNGRHERMHRTLKADAIGSAAIGRGIHSQQRVFDHFRHEYNSERPHEALGMSTPATFYEPSNRTYPRKLESPEYPADWLVHRVRRDGSIRLGDEDLFVSAALRGEPVGLEETSEGELRIHYGPLHLATITAKGKLTRGTRRRTQPQLDDPKREIVPTRLQSDHAAAQVIGPPGRHERPAYHLRGGQSRPRVTATAGGR
jgi:putative transposase